MKSDLQWREVMVDQEGQTPDRNHQKLHSEGVMVSIVGGLEFDINQVDGGVCTADVDDLREEDKEEGEEEEEKV